MLNAQRSLETAGACSFTVPRLHVYSVVVVE